MVCCRFGNNDFKAYYTRVKTHEIKTKSNVAICINAHSLRRMGFHYFALKKIFFLCDIAIFGVS